MSGQSGVRPRPHIARVELEYPILEKAREGRPFIQILQGPRGAGKTTLLQRLASRLAADGVTPVLIDFDRICTSPIDFARAFLSAVGGAAGMGVQLPPESSTALLRRQLESECGRRRPDPVTLLELALSAPRLHAEETGRPMVLLLDEAAETLRLTRHAGLRDGLRLICRGLGNGPFGVIAAVSPASRPGPFLERLAAEAAEPSQTVTVPPMSEREVMQLAAAHGCPPPRDSERALWLNATNGHPLYVVALSARVAAGDDLATAMLTAMTPPLGTLHQECRYDYHLLVERSRGQAVVRAILDLLARVEGTNLTRVAQHLKIALPTALDYLSWLLEVGLARRDGGGYVITDPLLALWIRLNGPDAGDPLETVIRFMESPRVAPRPAARPRGRRPGSARPARVASVTSPEFRIEID